MFCSFLWVESEDSGFDGFSGSLTFRPNGFLSASLEFGTAVLMIFCLFLPLTMSDMLETFLLSGMEVSMFLTFSEFFDPIS